MKTSSEHRDAINAALTDLAAAMDLAKIEADVPRQRALYGNIRHRQYVPFNGAVDAPEACHG